MSLLGYLVCKQMFVDKRLDAEKGAPLTANDQSKRKHGSQNNDNDRA